MEGAQGTHKASKLAPEDVISSMPDSVITNIMNRLPIRDALRTGILARNWRLKWTLLTQLVFDYRNPQSSSRRKCKKHDDSRMISRLLLLLKGLVTKFVLYIDDGQILDVGDFNHWVLFLSTRGVKEFTFKYYTWPPFKLPTHLFSWVELTHLKLLNCSFNPPPTFTGFPNLLSLQLKFVEFEGGNFGEFITACPLLQIMDIRLIFINSGVKINLDDISKLENLKKLTLSFPELENSVITTFSIFQFLGSLPKLEELYLDFHVYKFVVKDVARKCVATAFPFLSTLTLDGINFGSCNMLSYAFGMIWGSPNLQKLRIETSHYGDADEFNVSNTLGQLQLQSVEIERFRGLKNEVFSSSL